MKKLFSFLLAVAVMAASVSSVFAAVNVADLGEDGNYLVESTTVPAKSYYQAVTPSTSIVATQLTTKADVKAASTTAFSNNAKANLTNYDVYKLDITISDMGEIVNGFDENWEAAYAGVYGVTVTLPTAAVQGSYIAPGQIAGGTASAGQDGANFNVLWSASAVTNPYPIFDENADPIITEYQANGSMTISMLVTLTKGSSLSLSNVATKVVYVGSGFTGGSAENNNAAAATLTLPPAEESKPVTGITLNPTVLNFTVGGAAQTISATVAPNDADDPSIDWTTSNSSVATVAGGVVTPVGVGSATITATAHDGSGVTATCAVTVSPVLVSGITLDKSEIQLQVGEGTATITATVAPPTATDATVNWTTSDASVATVAGGVVTPVGAGTAVITATANDGSGANATCAVTVKAANPAPVLSQNFTKIDLGEQIENLVGEKFDADKNYGAGRITALIDTVTYDYKVVASDYDDETVTKSWDYAISEAEIAEGTINFIAIVKSATHKIGNIWLQAVVK